MLAIARQGAAFSPVERELVEELAAHMALALENRRLGELMRQTDDELRGILEGVADAVVVEDPSGRIMYRNPAADALLGELPDLASALGVSADVLPSRRIFAGELPRPLVVRHADGRRWSRVNSTAVPERGRPRLAISTIEDITDIKRAEEAQRFLAESSRVLASSLDLNETLSRVERLAAGWIGGQWTVDVRPVSATPPAPSTDALRVPIRVRAGVAGEITLSGAPVGPLETAVAEDLALRVGSAVDLARVYPHATGGRADAAGLAAATRPAADRGPGDRRAVPAGRGAGTSSAGTSTTCSRPARTRGISSAATSAPEAPRRRP